MPNLILPDLIRLTLDPTDLGAALVYLRATSPGQAQQRALAAAAELLPAAGLALDRRDGTILLTSPRSGQVYRLTIAAPTAPTADAHSALCAAGLHGKPCWHSAVARIIARVWATYAPRWRCPYCCGPMVLDQTLGGERCAECLACGHTHMRWAEDLVAWPDAPVQRPQAAQQQPRRRGGRGLCHDKRAA